MSKKNLAVIILAAGKGTRMKSETPKVLHPVCGRPMIGYVLDLANVLKANRVIAVLGYKHREVREFIGADAEIVIQRKLRGTADAVRQAMPLLKGFSGTVLVLCADSPLLKKESIDKLVEYHRKNSPACTLLTASVDKPSGYGRIIRDRFFAISAIVEERDADEFQKDIKEINTGIACFDKDDLDFALKKIKPNNAKKEYYLTDAVNIFYEKCRLTEDVRLEDVNESIGINSRVDLAKASSLMQKRINEEFMQRGVTIVHSDSVFIDYGAQIGGDTVIYPFTVIEKGVKIGKRCLLGPFAHLREGTRIDNEVLIGNFLEITRSELGQNTIAKHFSYLGDVKIGKNVNIGAGTVTANFDGKKKHPTVIKDNAFIGSDTILIAPVRVGKDAKTGAGSVVLSNNNIADNSVVAGVPARGINKKR